MERGMTRVASSTLCLASCLQRIPGSGVSHELRNEMAAQLFIPPNRCVLWPLTCLSACSICKAKKRPGMPAHHPYEQPRDADRPLTGTGTWRGISSEGLTNAHWYVIT